MIITRWNRLTAAIPFAFFDAMRVTAAMLTGYCIGNPPAQIAWLLVMMAANVMAESRRRVMPMPSALPAELEDAAVSVSYGTFVPAMAFEPLGDWEYDRDAGHALPQWAVRTRSAVYVDTMGREVWVTHLFPTENEAKRHAERNKGAYAGAVTRCLRVVA